MFGENKNDKTTLNNDNLELVSMPNLNQKNSASKNTDTNTSTNNKNKSSYNEKIDNSSNKKNIKLIAPLKTPVGNTEVKDKKNFNKKEKEEKSLVEEKKTFIEPMENFQNFGDPKWSNIFDYKKRTVQVDGNKFSNVTECFISGNYKNNFILNLYKKIYKRETYYLLLPLNQNYKSSEVFVEFKKIDQEEINKSYRFKIFNNKFYYTQLTDHLIKKLKTHSNLYLIIDSKNIQLGLKGIEQAFLKLQNECKLIH